MQRHEEGRPAFAGQPPKLVGQRCRDHHLDHAALTRTGGRSRVVGRQLEQRGHVVESVLPVVEMAPERVLG